MDTEDLNMTYLYEPGINVHSPRKMAEDYLKSHKNYRECVEKGYFTKLDLALYFATFKAKSDAAAISSESGQLVDKCGLDDAADQLLSEQLHMDLADVRNIPKKIEDGFNRFVLEKRAKAEKLNAPTGICIEPIR
ncbi:MAG: hypothetical protein V1839_00505 [archaeon]